MRRTTMVSLMQLLGRRSDDVEGRGGCEEDRRLHRPERSRSDEFAGLERDPWP